MSELIKYIADILNIKTDSVYTIQDMTDELSKVRDIVAYRSYIRDNIKNIDLDYTTGFQKFIILTSRYIKMEDDALFKTEAVSFAEALLKKVKSCMNEVESRPAAFSQIAVDGEKLFTEKELNALLTTFGGIQGTISAAREGYFVSSISSRYVKRKTSPKPYEQLPDRMKSMLAGTTMKMTEVRKGA